MKEIKDRGPVQGIVSLDHNLIEIDCAMNLYQNIGKYKLYATVKKPVICTVAHPGTFGG